MNTIKETKEIQVVKEQSNKALAVVNELKINSLPTYKEGEEMLSKIHQVDKLLKNTKDGMVKPINEALKNIRSFFKPYEENLTEAKSILKTKMQKFADEERKKAEEKRKAIEEKAKKEEITIEKAGAKAEMVEKRVEEFKTRTVKKVEIVDEKKIPQQYWVVDMVAVRKDALNGVAIDGVKVVEEEIVVAR